MTVSHPDLSARAGDCGPKFINFSGKGCLPHRTARSIGGRNKTEEKKYE